VQQQAVLKPRVGQGDVEVRVGQLLQIVSSRYEWIVINLDHVLSEHG
jgi:hypothetical protein